MGNPKMAVARSSSDGSEGVTAVSTMHTPSASHRQSMFSVASKWSECEFADGEMVFSMTELTTSNGSQRSATTSSSICIAMLMRQFFVYLEIRRLFQSHSCASRPEEMSYLVNSSGS